MIFILSIATAIVFIYNKIKHESLFDFGSKNGSFSKKQGIYNQTNTYTY